MSEQDHNDQNDMTFEEVFRYRFECIKKRARAAGTNLTAINQELGISNACQHRWKKQVPISIRMLDRMDAAVSQKEREKALHDIEV